MHLRALACLGLSLLTVRVALGGDLDSAAAAVGARVAALDGLSSPTRAERRERAELARALVRLSSYRGVNDRQDLSNSLAAAVGSIQASRTTAPEVLGAREDLRLAFDSIAAAVRDDAAYERGTVSVRRWLRTIDQTVVSGDRHRTRAAAKWDANPAAAARSYAKAVLSFRSAASIGLDRGDHPDQVVAAGAESPANLVATADGLCWTESGESPVRIAAAPGAPPRMLAYRMGVPHDIALAGRTLLSMEAFDGFSPSGCVGTEVRAVLYATDLGGPDAIAARRVLVRLDGCGAGDVATDGIDVYWTDSLVSPDSTSIRRVALAGGEPSTFVASADAGAAGSLLLAGGELFWLDAPVVGGGRIRRVATQGGTPSDVYVSNLIVSRPVIAGSDLVFAERHFPDFEIRRVPAAGGAATTIATLSERPSDLAVSGTSVFWFESTSLRSAPLAGGSPTTVVTGLSFPMSLVARDATLFWIEAGPVPTAPNGVIRSVPAAGGSVSTLLAGATYPRTLAIDATDVYLAEGSSAAKHARVTRVPRSGAAPSTVCGGINGTPAAMLAAGDFLYVADGWFVKRLPRSGGATELVAWGSFDIAALASDATSVYWTEDPFTLVRRAPLDGGQSETLAIGSGPAGRICVVGDTVFWADHFDTVNATPAAGGETQTLASDLHFVTDLVTDGTDVYFVELDGGAVHRISPGGGGPVLVLQDPALPSADRRLVVDRRALFWSRGVAIGGVLRSIARWYGPLVTSGMAESLALDDTQIYWADPSAGVIGTRRR